MSNIVLLNVSNKVKVRGQLGKLSFSSFCPFVHLTVRFYISSLTMDLL